MKVYTTDKIRNVALFGHGGCGKTSLVEAMGFVGGLVTRMGKVVDKNTISDFGKEEQNRQFSITTSLVPIEWNGVKINVLDTPGFFDFVGEAEEAASAADLAIIVVSGKAGVQVGTRKAYELCEKNSLPIMFYVTDMDIDDVSYMKVYEELNSLYGSKVVPFALPINEGSKVTGFVDVVAQKGYKFDGKDVKECDVPGDVADDLETYREAMMEVVAESSEEFMDRYFGGDTFTDDEINEALCTSINDDSIVPVMLGSGLLCLGVKSLLDAIVKFAPSPAARSISGTNVKTDEEFVADYDDSKAKSAYIFKTLVDPFIGKYSLVKICSGVLKTDDVMYNDDENVEEKIGKLYVLCGGKPTEVPELHSGDIGALAKLTDAKTGSTLSTKTAPIKYELGKISTPYTYKRYKVPNKNDIDKAAQALQKMMQEDLTLKSINDAANGQTLLYGMGDQHLDIVKSRLLNEYKVTIELAEPKVAFRETIRKNSDVEAKYKKQSGGHGQYGHVKMRFEPSGDQESAYVFEQCVVGGTVPKNYFPAVEKGLQESVLAGPLAAYPVVGVKGILYDGSYHPVDSSELAFKKAASQAFKDGFMKAGPVLLEPIASLKVTVPDEFTGDVMGDLNKRRGRVLGMTPISGGKQIIESEIPMMSLYGYCTQLRSMTGGFGEYEYEFVRYEQAPANIQEAEVAARAELANNPDAD